MARSGQPGPSAETSSQPHPYLSYRRRLCRSVCHAISHWIHLVAMKPTAFLPLLALALAASAVAQAPSQTQPPPGTQPSGQTPAQPRARRPPPPAAEPAPPPLPPPPPPAVGTKFAAPATARTTYSFNADWKFTKGDIAGAQEVAFDDSKWETVSTPHTMNDVDSFRVIIDHSGGDRGTYKGISWYRKHFKLPADAAGSKVFLEFEGMRQAGEIYINGRPFGLYENGVTGIRRRHHLRHPVRRPRQRCRRPCRQHHYLPRARHRYSLPLERQRLQPRLRRHQSAGMAPCHRQDLSDPPALLRPGHHRHLHLLHQLQHCREELRCNGGVAGA